MSCNLGKKGFQIINRKEMPADADEIETNNREK
jgi:hypothetical protein